MSAPSPDPGAPEDRLADLLAAYDEALAAGLLSGDGGAPDEPTDPRSRDRLSGDRRVVDLLERVWPRRERGRGTGAPAVPAELGRFRIVRELGQGGFGVVYLAADPRLRRHVALKVPRAEALFTAELRNRFLREARATAALSHPGIVPVFDSGEVGTLCYLVSTYCPGGTLAAYLRARDRPLPARDAAAAVAVLAEAVQHAHARGILHRDIKPGNVLLDCTPDVLPAPGELGPVLRLADFGLAKFLDEDASSDPGLNGGAGRERPTAPSLTGTGGVLGTPEYMAPEQATGATAFIGPATDVHGLGALLYELLTGRSPFHGDDRAEVLRRVADELPPGPRFRCRGVPRDLDAICLKCLAKEPFGRYATAGDLAEDLRRFLAGEPTRARPLGVGGKLGRWARRQPAAALLVVVSAAAALGLVAGLAGYAVRVGRFNADLGAALQREKQERGRAEEQSRLARTEAYAAEVRLAASMGEDGQADQMRETLRRLRPGPGDDDLRGFEWYHLARQRWAVVRLRGHLASVGPVAFSPDGRLCASGSDDGNIRFWDAATGQLLADWKGLWVPIRSLAFSPDGKRLAAGGYDWRRGEVRLWDLATHSPVAERVEPGRPVFAVAFLPDGQTLAVGREGDDRAGGLVLWEPQAGRERAFMKWPCVVSAVAVSPDGKALAAAGSWGLGLLAPFPYHETGAAIILWDLPGLRESRWAAHRVYIQGLAFAPGGRRLASCGGLGEMEVKLWDLTTHTERPSFQVGEQLAGAAFSPDGQTLVTASTSRSGRGAVRLWDAATGRERDGGLELDTRVNSVAFAPDGRTLALGCADESVRLWRPAAEADTVVLRGHQGEAWSVAFAPDGRTLASASDDHTVKLWDPAPGRERATLRGHAALVSCVAFSPDGRRLATGSYDSTVRLWDPASGGPQTTLTGHTAPVRCLAFAPDGRTLASAGKDRVIRLWDVPAGRLRLTLEGHANQVHALAFAPDGRTLASAGEDGSVCLWDVAGGGMRLQVRETSEVWALAFSPGGRTLATGGKAGLIRFRDPATGKELAVLRGHTGPVYSVAFAPDGKTLASGGADRTVRLWQAATGCELLALKGQADEVYSVAFSPDGKALAAAVHDGTVKLWLAGEEPAAP